MVTIDSKDVDRIVLYLDQPTFCKDLDDEYLCVNCRGALYTPVQTPCGHRICRGCSEVLIKKGPIMCPVGESDCEIIQQNTVFYVDFWMNKCMSRLFVFCAFKERGCDYEISWAKLEGHLYQCDYRLVRCSNLRCTELVLATDRLQHQLNDCDFRNLNCEHCSESITYNKLHDHLEACSEVEVICPHNCSQRYFRRKALDFHLRTCSNISHDCTYKHIGCNDTFNQENLLVHLREKCNDHLKLAVLRLGQMEAKVASLKSEVAEKDTILDMFNVQLRKLLSEKAKLQEEHAIHMTESTLRLEKLAINIKKFEDELSETREYLATQKLKNADTEKQVDVLSRKLKQLDKTSGSEMESGYASGSGQLAPGNSLTIHKTAMVHSTSSEVFLWKITEYSTSKTEAKSGVKLWIDSAPFYSASYGYKLKLRMYPNGDGGYTNLYTSLYLVVMKGEYDNILSWPLDCLVHISVLSQAGGNNISQSFTSDMGSSSFQKPDKYTEANVATGFPDFTFQKQLESEEYLKDGILFVKVCVDIKH